MASRRTLTALAAATALTVLGVAGCSGAAPDAAVVVDGTTVTEQQVDQNVRGVALALGVPAEQINPQNVVGALISGLQAEKIARDNNVVITNEERQVILSADQTGTALAAQPDAKELAYDLADAQIVLQKVGQEKYVAQAQAIEVTLNPRYGSFKDGQMVGDSGSLSQPASPSPSAIP